MKELRMKLCTIWMMRLVERMTRTEKKTRMKSG
jgi:hypothetical protein